MTGVCTPHVLFVRMSQKSTRFLEATSPGGRTKYKFDHGEASGTVHNKHHHSYLIVTVIACSSFV